MMKINNIEFKNIKRDFYKIKCKIDDKNKKSEGIIIKENKLKSLQGFILLKSKIIKDKLIKKT